MKRRYIKVKGTELEEAKFQGSSGKQGVWEEERESKGVTKMVKIQNMNI